MEILKYCSKCRTRKGLSDFNRNRTKLDGRQSQCKACASVRSVVSFETKVASQHRRRAHKDKVIQWFKAYKATLVCSECGMDDPVCIDFHHINPDTKLFTVSKMAYAGFSIESVQSEINKCRPLCANCHRKLTANLVSQSAL